MHDFVMFIILLLLYSAGIALVFLILFSNNDTRSMAQPYEKSDDATKTSVTKSDVELVKKLYNTFSDDEIERLKRMHYKPNKIKYKKM